MERFGSKKKMETILVPCGWSGCTTQCSNDWELNGHITNHLEEWEVREVGRHTCPWHDCQFRTKCFNELQRHIYYHGYYNCLLERGKYECENNPSVPKCYAPPKDSFKLPELKTDFKCQWTDCERTFISIVEFHDHVIQHASFEYEILKSPNDTRPIIQCSWNYCKLELKNKYRFIEHIQTHTNKKHVACYKCGEIFRTKTTLFDHLRRQPDNNTHRYQCAQCYKFFGTEKLLRSHVVKHVNCYKCSMCDMTCSSSSSLATHIRYRHLKDKPFQCTDCDHRFVRRSDLAKHVQFIHSKKVHHCEKPGCNYAVRSYNLLRRHYLEMHGNSPFIYMCHCCENIFKTAKSLSAHLRKKHDYQHPAGHKRFTYRIDENGFFRLETRRIQSIEVMEQIMSPELADITEDSSCYEFVSLANAHDEQMIVSNEAELCPVGEVLISLPTIDDPDI